MFNLSDIKKDTVKIPFEIEKNVMRFEFRGSLMTANEISKAVNKPVGMVYYRLKIGASPDADLTRGKEEKKYNIEGIEFTIKQLSSMWLAKWGSCVKDYNPSSKIYGRINLSKKSKLIDIINF